MSRPHPPGQGFPSSRSSTPVMAETQSAPVYQTPPFLDYNNRRLPQPIQLPPLSIPGQASPRPEYHASPPPAQALPSIHSSTQAPPPPVPRSQPRSYTSQAAPLDKLLSPHPYTPPRSDSAYSPSHSPPRSATDQREAVRRGHERYPSEPIRPIHHERYPSESSRSVHQEGPYSSPIEPIRPTYSNIHSPASAYAPSYPQTSHYRQIVPPPTSVAPPPPPPTAAYASPAYSEPASVQPPHRSLIPAIPPPPQVLDRSYVFCCLILKHLLTIYSGLRYELKVRQQPIAARACGFGERDRRVIDPPPIIQLTVRDPKTGIVDLDELRYSLNVVHCTLWNADGTGEETALVQPDRRSTRRLMGQLVASPSVAKDEHDVEGCFFCFPDLSCRTHGRYRLRFILMRIDPSNLRVGDWSPILTEVLSDVFTVYTAKDFPGMRPSSALTRALKLQGCNIQVKKGNEKALARKRQSPSSGDDGNEDGKGAKKRRLE